MQYIKSVQTSLIIRIILKEAKIVLRHNNKNIINNQIFKQFYNMIYYNHYNKHNTKIFHILVKVRNR